MRLIDVTLKYTKMLPMEHLISRVLDRAVVDLEKVGIGPRRGQCTTSGMTKVYYANGSASVLVFQSQRGILYINRSENRTWDYMYRGCPLGNLNPEMYGLCHLMFINPSEYIVVENNCLFPEVNWYAHKLGDIKELVYKHYRQMVEDTHIEIQVPQSTQYRDFNGMPIVEPVDLINPAITGSGRPFDTTAKGYLEFINLLARSFVHISGTRVEKFQRLEACLMMFRALELHCLFKYLDTPKNAKFILDKLNIPHLPNQGEYNECLTTE